MKIMTTLTFVFFLATVMFLANSFAQDLPKGAKARISIDAPLSKTERPTLKYSPDGKWIAVGTIKGFWIYAANTQEELWSHPRGNIDPISPYSPIVFSPNGELFVSGEKGKILLWDTKTKKNRQTIVTKKFPMNLAFSPDGKTLASTDAETFGIRLWDVETGSSISSPLKGHKYPPSALVFSTDRSTLISVSKDGTLRLWEVKTGNPSRIFEVPFSNTPGHTRSKSIIEEKYEVRAWAFSEDSKMLASGNKKVLLWDTRTGRKLASFDPRGRLFALAFSPDGKILVSGSKNIRLWNIETGHELSNRPIEETVLALAFSPDGKILATVLAGGEESSILLWDVDSIISDTLSGNEKAEAEKVKKWLKEQNYVVGPGVLLPPNESVGLAGRLGAGTDSGSGKVTMMYLGFDTNIGASKYRVSIEGVGSAVFIFDKNGELQSTK